MTDAMGASQRKTTNRRVVLVAGVAVALVGVWAVTHRSHSPDQPPKQRPFAIPADLPLYPGATKVESSSPSGREYQVSGALDDVTEWYKTHLRDWDDHHASWRQCGFDADQDETGTDIWYFISPYTDDLLAIFVGEAERGRGIMFDGVPAPC